MSAKARSVLWLGVSRCVFDNLNDIFGNVLRQESSRRIVLMYSVDDCPQATLLQLIEPNTNEIFLDNVQALVVTSLTAGTSVNFVLSVFCKWSYWTLCCNGLFDSHSILRICGSHRSTSTITMFKFAVVHPFLPVSFDHHIVLTQMSSDSSICPN